MSPPRSRDTSTSRRPTASSTVVRVLAIVTTIAAVAVPAAVAADRLTDDPTVSDQAEAPTPTLPRDEVRAYTEHAQDAPATAPIVLSYHDVRPEPGPDDPYTLTPDQFADQMAMLHAAGFTPIDQEQLLAWTRGEAELPPHPVVLTFDDSTRGMWAHADPILERYGFPAIVFAITGQIGEHRPYYLSWSELKLMQESGRWDIGSHTGDGHHRIPISPQGDVGPFLTQQRWLEDESRLETVEEFRARISTDLQRSIDELTEHGIPEPELFAFPFSAAEPIPYDAELEEIVRDELRSRFASTMINSEQPGPLTHRDVEDHELRRLEVLNTMSDRELFDRLIDVKPVDLEGRVGPLGDPGRWLDNSFQSVTDEITDGRWRPEGGTWSRIAYAPGQTAHWASYEAAATVADLGGAGEDRYAGLTALSGTDREVNVNVSGDYVTVQHGQLGERVAGRALRPADSHDIQLIVSDQGVVVRVDGLEVAELPGSGPTETGGVALVAGRAEGGEWATVTGLRVRPLGSRA